MSRRVPSQERSKEKYDQLLLSAKALIGEKGNDLVSMKEISKHSGVTLPSIYQYFPNKASILKAIMEGYFAEIRASLITLLDSCDSIQELSEQLYKGIDIFYQRFEDEPVLAVLWSGLQANVQLRELDAKDSAINAELITDKICSIIGDEKRTDIYTSLLLLVSTAGMTVRITVMMPDEQAEKILEEFKTLFCMRMQSLLEV